MDDMRGELGEGVGKLLLRATSFYHYSCMPYSDSVSMERGLKNEKVKRCSSSESSRWGSLSPIYIRRGEWKVKWLLTLYWPISTTTVGMIASNLFRAKKSFFYLSLIILSFPFSPKKIYICFSARTPRTRSEIIKIWYEILSCNAMHSNRLIV